MRGILGAGFRAAVRCTGLIAAAFAAQAHALCPAPGGIVLERFVSADCELCWAERPPDPEKARAAFAIDWIVPSGSASPLAALALAEAAARAERAGGLMRDEALTVSHPLRSPSALCIEASAGFAVNGYVALRFAASYAGKRPLPADLSGWIALIERVAAGEEGSQVERHVVRALVGPLDLGTLARAPVSHVRAVRVPEAGRPERWTSIGWIETGRGRIVAIGRGARARE